ncbi:MAG: transporter [Pseudomonadales bacterium]|nr:transporter [Pseudomonadales bacterium]
MYRWMLLLPACLAVQVQAAPPFERPGLGLTPDTLTEHFLAFEQGFPDASIDQRGSPEITTLDFNSLLRLRLIPRLELQVGINSYRYQKLDTGRHDNDVDGLGDSSLGAKVALYRGERFRAAFLGGMLLDTASDTFSDEEDGSFAAVSGGWWLDDRHQLQLSVRYDDSGEDRWLTVVPSWHARLSDEWAVFLDAGLSRNEENGNDNNRAGGGVTWMLTPTIQFDLYGRGALDSDSVDTEAGMGIAVAF